MGYITPEYYHNEYVGRGVADDATLLRYIERASDVIDQLTGYQLFAHGIDDCLPIIKNMVKRAVAAQVEYIVINGEDIVNSGESASNVSIGNFSYGTGSQNGDKTSRNAKRVSPMAINFLIPTGLLYKGVS